MNYKINVTTNSGEREISGIDINEVLQEAARLQFGYKASSFFTSSERERGFNRIKKELAITTTEGLEALSMKDDSILKERIEPNSLFNWEQIKGEFEKKNEYPKQGAFPPEPELIIAPPKPKTIDYQPQLTFMDKLNPTRKKVKIDNANDELQQVLKEWKKVVADIETKNTEMLRQYEQTKKNIIDDYNTRLEIYNKRNKEHLEQVVRFESEYKELKPNAVEKVVTSILENSKYSAWESFEKNVKVKYNPFSKVLVVEYQLPAPEDQQIIKAIKYVQARDIFSEVLMSEAEQKKQYQKSMYQLVLRSLYDLFISDEAQALDAIVFNGYVNTIDRGTGQNIEPTILSVSVDKETFLALNLREVVPKECFKKLKGVAATDLHNLAPIAPILDLKKEDNRFVPSYEVIEGVDTETNLAAMDWEDFENLIRELFEKEFAVNGGEVKVTQASRDGGVDAVAFDPDPIRGGKIIIQAKRYTNVVGVAAVRDLYGTVINEGATKGILVTTADYGSDSIQFAKDKPITLLNGNHLLHLLNKHGYKARINIAEAKKIMKL